MTRIKDHGWKEADRILREFGFEIERTGGDHIAYWREGLVRPVIVPKYDSLPPFIVSNIIRTSGISRKDYARKLSPGKKKKQKK